MARQFPYSLTPYQRRIYKRRIDKYQLRPVFLKQQPIFSKDPTLLQEKGGWRSLYLDRVDPKYAASLTGPTRMNTIGWYNGQVVFIFLRGKIGPVLQKNAFDELETKHKQFTSCKKSARPELKNAGDYNQHEDPLASEFNPGHRTNSYAGNDIVVSKHGLTKDCPATVKLVERMWDIFQLLSPMQFMRLNTRCPEPFRIGNTGFTRLAVLKSAASAIHRDNANGAGFACMTTLSPFPGYTGGTFCFVEFGLKIAVRPGDILMANTPAHWHCNIGPIKGLKYSVVAYNNARVSSEKLVKKYRGKTGVTFRTQAERDEIRKKQIARRNTP